MGLGDAAVPPLDDGPTPGWVAATLGIGLEEADWLLICYRFADQDAPRPSYFCEPL